MSIIQNIISCMRGYRSETYRSRKLTKIRFGVPLSKLSQKSCSHLPKPLFDLLVYLAQEGVKVNDLFRRPGNAVQMREIIEMLSSGKEIDWSNYNLYTAANVVKKYFISLPGGLFGRKFESILLNLYSENEDVRRSTFRRILRQLPNANRELAILTFGILFRMVSHAVDEYLAEMSTKPNTSNNTEITTAQQIQSHKSHSSRYAPELMLAEAVAKSVAGSMFHLCTSSPDNVEKAANVLQGLILDFPSFEEVNVDFYYRSTTISYKPECQNYFSYSAEEKRKFSDFEEFSQIDSKDEDSKVTKDDSYVSHGIEVPVFTITNPYGDVENVSTDSSPIFEKRIRIYSHNDDHSDEMSLRSSKSTGYEQVRERQMRQMRLRSDWFQQPSSLSQRQLSGDGDEMTGDISTNNHSSIRHKQHTRRRQHHHQISITVDGGNASQTSTGYKGGNNLAPNTALLNVPMSSISFTSSGNIALSAGASNSFMSSELSSLGNSSAILDDDDDEENQVYSDYH